MKRDGITLIALVISIIVMLILAGISLNAVIGDNGIISQAQNATYMQSVAVLEEFLQQEYVKYYESVDKYDNKLDGLINEANTKNYFQRAKNSSYYFLDPSTYKEYYFIEKSALPEEISNQLRGGETSLTGTGIYADFNDIYGVTSDLRVYYCQNSNSDRIGAVDNATETDLDKVVFDKEKDADWLETLGLEDEATLNDIRTITSITIDNSNLDLSKIANLGSLQEITFTNIEKDNLNGIQDAINLNYIYFQNCKISDYSAIGKVSKLKYLYFLLSNNNINSNEQLEILCDTTKGIGNVDMPNLEYFGIFGYNPISQNTFTTEQNNVSIKSNLSDISPLNNLSKVTKETVKYLLINNNQITSFQALIDFKNIYLMRAECNSLATLEGLDNMSNLTYLFANSNNLGINETEESSGTDALAYLKNNNKLNYVNLKYNTNLKYVSYLKNYSTIRQLYLLGCENMDSDSLYAIVNIINGCGSNYSIPSKYTLLLLNENTTSLDLSSQTLSEENFKLIKNYKKISTLKLNNMKLTNSENNSLSNTEINTVINDTLKELTNLKYLGLVNISGLSNIGFATNTKSLVEIDLRGTSVTDLTLLNDITSIRQFAINNENIDITTIQTTINRCTGSTGLYGTWYNCGICLGGKESLLKQLENCTELTYLRYSYQNSYSSKCDSYTLDLSNCTKLTKVAFNQSYLYTVILPNSIENLDLYWAGSGFKEYPNLSNLENLNYLKIQASGLDTDGYRNLFNELSGNTTLTVLDDNEFRREIIPENINLPNLEKLNLDFWNGSTSSNNLDLTGFYTANLPNLTELNLRGQSIKDLSGIEALTSLITLNLNENKITDISNLENLKKLETLKLEENTLYDTFQIQNEAGETKTYRTLEIIKNMHPNNGGSLKNIYLSGNNSITDWSLINNLSWSEKSGF